ncbi:hypothetical protein FOY51_01355 [Antrihabitans cavernicola]|uniref:Uncharacterized protein n=1 Tax=Antrihabitans cavernicola TaxID=2495913 RepID=A0A5A7SLD6_9NOCA|nr:hypothetical protein FOY51_01355 [Spelaeibacter cavernicola]
MRTTSGTSLLDRDLTATADGYSDRGWNVATTANGISLITDADVAGIEIPAEHADAVRHYMRANQMVGPVIELPGTPSREIHLVTGIANASMAIAALRAIGAIVHMDGAGIPLPPTQLVAGSARWSVSPEESRWLPPVVAVGAAVRAVTSARWSESARRVAS